MVTRKPSANATLRVSAAMMVLVTLALILRMLAKRRTKTGLVLEDWLILLAVALFGTHNGLLLHGIMGPGSGGSSNLGELGIPQLIHFLKHLYWVEIVFALAITTVKLSILSFYRRIFPVQSFNRWVLLLGSLCLAWLIVLLFVTIFQCTPISAAWNVILHVMGGRCMKPSHLVFGSELTNVLLDIWILCLPIYMIRRLQLPARRKWAVSSVFLLGSFVCVTCIFRMYYTYDPHNPMGHPLSMSLAMDWTTVELATAIVCACLPTYGPLMKGKPKRQGRIRGRWHSLRSLRSGIRRSRPSPKGSSAENNSGSLEGHYRPGPNDEVQVARPTPALVSRTTMYGSHRKKGQASNGINVQNTVEIV